jgi:hypothetical protein
MRRIAVIAKYQEDTTWTLRLKVPSFIVEKGKEMPNVGRETSSYLWYIVTHYDQLQGMYIFCQGNPFDHEPLMVEKINQTLEV